MNKTTLYQFIPIIVIFLALSNSKQFVYYSDSVLGKLLALVVVLFYTMLDKTMGALTAVLVIVYYQSDFFERWLNKHVDAKKWVETVSSKVISVESIVNQDTQPVESDVLAYEASHPRKMRLSEGISTLSNAYSSAASDHTTVLLNDFRQEYCETGKLKYKNMDVKPDMIEHVFPEIQFKEKVCNPCNDSCTFSIIENRLKTESEIMPKPAITKE